MMDDKAFQARVAGRAKKRQAARDKMDRRSNLIRSSLNRLRAGQPSGMGELVAQQKRELQDEHRRLKDGEPVLEAATGGQGEADG